MRRLALVAFALVLVGAKQSCSPCEEARARAEAVCRLQPGSQACAEAQAEAEKACAPKPTPVPTPEPTPTPDTEHVPVCAPPEVVTLCWHQPPEGWRWNCAGGQTVTKPSECPPFPEPTPTPIPTPTPTPGCEPLPGPFTCQKKGKDPGDLPPDAAGEHDEVVHKTLDAVCAAMGGPCPGGAPRPGAWDEFVFRVGSHASTVGGLCVTYDYQSGESGRASEMSLRKPGSDKVYNYQIETSQGKVRRPTGAFRSICTGGGEGQPLRPPVASTGCPPGSPPVARYLLTDCRVKAGGQEVFCDSTPKVQNRAYCDPDVFCAYKGGEGSAQRVACERELAWPTWVTIAPQGAPHPRPRGDNPFSADAKRGVTIKVCKRGPDGEAVEPCSAPKMTP